MNPSLEIDLTSDISGLPLLLEALDNKKNWGLVYKNKLNGQAGHFAYVSFPPSNIASCIATVQSLNQKQFLWAVCEAIGSAIESYKEYEDIFNWGTNNNQN